MLRQVGVEPPHGHDVGGLVREHAARFARLGPGNLLFHAVLRREAEAGRVGEVNCTTDMAWHRNWDLPRARHLRATVTPRRPVPLALGWAPAAAKAAAKRVGWLRRRFATTPVAEDPRPAPEPAP